MHTLNRDNNWRIIFFLECSSMDCIYFVEIKCWKIIIVWNYEIFVWKSGDRDIVIKLFLNYMSHRNTNVKYCQINNSKKCYETVPDVLHFWRCKFFSGWKSHNSGGGYGDGLGCLWKIFTCLLCLQIKNENVPKKKWLPKNFPHLSPHETVLLYFPFYCNVFADWIFQTATLEFPSTFPGKNK